MISQDGCAIIVDPGDAEPVIDALKQYNLKLECILVTHHHSDHIGGIQSLVQKTGAQVIAPNHPSIPKPYQVAKDNDQLMVLGNEIQVIAVPGHLSLIHI